MQDYKIGLQLTKFKLGINPHTQTYDTKTKLITGSKH